MKILTGSLCFSYWNFFCQNYMELEWLVFWHVHEGNKSKDFKAIFFWLLLFQYSIHSVYFLNECYTNFKFHGIHLLHRINPYCTVFGSHLLHRMHPYYTVIGSHLLHIINPWLHWFWFNFTLYYLYLASDYTISDYTVFQKYSIQCIPGSCCISKTRLKKSEYRFFLPNFSSIFIRIPKDCLF